jgi:dolichyl-phosphate-mannose-protein mannosyltransferase
VARALILFIAAHLALMIELTTPDKITCDEMHDLPAAKQMLEYGTSNPILNPMHPSPAKQLMAMSIRTFGDVPFGWRYPSVLFGSLAIVAMQWAGWIPACRRCKP